MGGWLSRRRMALLGQLDEAEAAAMRVFQLAEADPNIGLDVAPAELALGIAAMARGQYDDAARYLRLVDRMKREAGIRDPRLFAHVSDLIEALLGAGELDEATAALARFTEEAANVRWPMVAGRRRTLPGPG